MKPNPIDPSSHPPRYVQGFPSDSIWRYKGREIQVKAPKAGARDKAWWADWRDHLDPEHHFTAEGTDQQDALANARHAIDTMERGTEFWFAEKLVHHTLNATHDHTRKPITRGLVARGIEKVRKSRRPGAAYLFRGIGGPHPVPVTQKHFDAFDALALEERVRLIDEVIAYQRRAGMLKPQRLPNPRKKKGTEKRTTRAERQRILRRLLRL